jgi:radical SAM protein with 4Fe4S-binding SPASM domain
MGKYCPKDPGLLQADSGRKNLMIVSGIGKTPHGFARNIDLVKRHMWTFYKHNTSVKFVNLCAIYLQRWMKRSVLSAYPFEIIIDPTNICTLRCPLCPTGQNINSRPPGRMLFENYREIIDDLGRWLYKVRFYSWGEPLLHKDIYKMIAYATDKNIGTEISTNFNVFEESDVEKLINSGLELLIVSLDGADEKTYARYRIGGDFHKVIRNITAVVREKKRSASKYPVIEIQLLVMRHNEDQISRLISLSREIGVNRLRIGPVTVNMKNADDREWLPTNEKISRYSYKKKKDKIYSRRKKCEWLWRSTVINWDGTIAPCCVFEGKKTEMGSLNGRKFSDIWNNKKYKCSREVLINRSSKNNEMETICTRCRGMPVAADADQHGLY